MENERKGLFGRRRLSFKQKLQGLLDMPVVTEDDALLCGAFGVDPGESDLALAILMGLCMKAKKGDVSAVKEIRSILGKDKAADDLRLKRQALKMKAQKNRPDDGEALAALSMLLEEEE